MQAKSAHLNAMLRKLHAAEVNAEWRCSYALRVVSEASVRDAIRQHQHAIRRHRALLEASLPPRLQSVLRWMAPMIALYLGGLLPLLSVRWFVATEAVLTATKLQDYTDCASWLGQKSVHQALHTTIRQIEADTQTALDKLRAHDDNDHSVVLKGWLGSIAFYTTIIRKIA